MQATSSQQDIIALARAAIARHIDTVVPDMGPKTLAEARAAGFTIVTPALRQRYREVNRRLSGR
jgi:hypothetical protein